MIGYKTIFPGVDYRYKDQYRALWFNGMRYIVVRPHPHWGKKKTETHVFKR